MHVHVCTLFLFYETCNNISYFPINHFSLMLISLVSTTCFSLTIQEIILQLSFYFSLSLNTCTFIAFYHDLVSVSGIAISFHAFTFIYFYKHIRFHSIIRFNGNDYYKVFLGFSKFTYNKKFFTSSIYKEITFLLIQ